MIKDFLYFNEEAINKYGPQISEEFLVEYTNVSSENSRSLGFSGNLERGLAPISINYNNARKQGFEGIVLNSVASQYNKFEKALKALADQGVYLDFLENDDLNDLTSSSRNIIKVEGQFYIPEEFDPMEMIEDHKDLLMTHSPMETEMENDFMNKWFINKENALVPFKLTLGSEQINAFSKVNKNSFLVDYDKLEEYEEDDLVFLFKANGYKRIKKEKVVFDTVKDFFCIPRSVRRQFAKSDLYIEGIEDIKMHNDYLDIEILAIYR